MARYTKRPKAEADLLEIWLYIAQDSPRAADRLLDRIEAQCRCLRTILGSGARARRSRRTRGWIVGRYLVLYQERDGGIEVVRVVHGAREIGQIEF